MGFSTGAAVSILAAEEEGAEAVIADSPYANLEDYLKSDLNKWVHLPAFPFNNSILYAMEVMSGMDTGNADPSKALSGLTSCRLLLIHGKGDDIIPVENSRMLNSLYAEAAPGMGELWETDDTGNATSYLKHPDEYMKKVFEFLDKITNE